MSAIKYKHPITVEINLQSIIETVEDKDKPRLVEIMLGSIMQKGIVKEIRDIVNQPGYDD